MEEFLQQNEINENNANLIFKPKFIPFYPELIEEGLTISEALVYGFIDFYLNRNDKFYFTNEQIGNIFGFGERNTILVINKLKEKGLIETNYSIKANGGKIRFIKKCSSEVKNFSVPKGKILSYNNNKINNNKINKNYFSDEKLNNSFLDFINNRKELKIKMTDLAIDRMVNKIKKWQDKYTNAEIISFIDESIANSRRGLFELKIDKNKKKERTEAEKKEMFKFAEQITKMGNNNKKTRADDLFF